MTLVGESDQDCPEGGAGDASVDCWLQTSWPGLHDHLDIIGFRARRETGGDREDDH